MEFKNFYNNPKLYDAESNTICEDCSFWKKMIQEYNPQSILEVGCGTGRIAKSIINNYINYTGIDLSMEFLQYFSDTISETQKRQIVLVEGDACIYQFNKKFDLTILPYNFISHISSDEELEKLFVNLRSALNQNGRIIVDYFNPQIRFLDMVVKEQFCYEFVLGKEMIKVYESHNYDEFSQINCIERKYQIKEEIIQNCQLPIRVFFKKELEYIIKNSGLSVCSIYGNYNFEGVDKYCEKLIYVLSLT